MVQHIYNRTLIPKYILNYDFGHDLKCQKVIQKLLPEYWTLIHGYAQSADSLVVNSKEVIHICEPRMPRYSSRRNPITFLNHIPLTQLASLM